MKNVKKVVYLKNISMKRKFSSEKTRLFLYFILIALIGSVLLSLPVSYKEGIKVNYIDALFTSVSAICVTGLSTLSMEIFSRTGLVFILILIEAGGLGILTYISFLMALASKKISVVNGNLVKDFYIDEIEFNPKNILQKVILFTLLIQLAGFILLMPGLYNAGDKNFIFDSLFLSISAFCNAGFSPYADSLASFSCSWYVLSVIMILIVLGGIGFIVFTNIAQKIKYARKGQNFYISLHVKIVLISTAVLIVAGFALTLLSFYNTPLWNLPLSKKILTALFESVTLRTAGFETIPQNSFSPAASLFHLTLMFIGGSPGSIAGGVKTTTAFITLLYLLDGNEKRNTVCFGKRRIPSSIINKSVTIVSRSVMILIIAAICLSHAEKNSILNGSFSVMDIIFETVSALATVGLSRNVTPQLSFMGKIIIIMTMYIGRTGIYAMSIKSGFTGSDNEDLIYPEESVLIG